MTTKTTKATFIKAMVPVIFLIMAGLLAAAALASYHYAHVDKPVAEVAVEVVEDDVDLVVLPLPGGVPLGGGLYLW